jgi:hypothetical protein
LRWALALKVPALMRWASLIPGVMERERGG